MFRRFMIVCWVIFGLVAVPTAIAAIVYYQNDAAIKEHALSSMGSEPSAREIRKGLAEIVLAFETYAKSNYPDAHQSRSQVDWSENRVIRGEAIRVANNLARKPASLEGVHSNEAKFVNKYDQYALKLLIVERYFDRQAAWGDTIFLGIIVAVPILLWNIIWHIGHWIWLGRKSV